MFKTARVDREKPKDEETLTKLSALVDNVPQHRTAKKQRQLVQEALEQPEGDCITVAVSAEKIQNARGTRGEVLSQKEVMGGISATEVRVPNPPHIPRYRLTLHRLQTNYAGLRPGNESSGLIIGQRPGCFQLRFVYPCKSLVFTADTSRSQWLHRCAFSWGGLGKPGNIHSSQLRENLVFGTSECNSVMTRYV